MERTDGLRVIGIVFIAIFYTQNVSPPLTDRALSILPSIGSIKQRSSVLREYRAVAIMVWPHRIIDDRIEKSIKGGRIGHNEFAASIFKVQIKNILLLKG